MVASDELKVGDGHDVIFIVGHPRSGSTLLASRLGMHSSLYSIPETHFFSSSYSGNFIVRLFASIGDNALYRYVFDRNIRIRDLPISTESWWRLFKEYKVVSCKSAFNLIKRHLLRHSSKARLVEKTPTHLEYVDTILRWYPDAKIIIILRDVRDAIDSLVAAPFTHNNPLKHCAHWGWCVRRSLIVRRKYPNNCTIVRFEDLVQKPTQTMEIIMRFIGESYEDVLVNGTSSTDVVPDWEKNWKTASIGVIDPSSAFKWRAKKETEWYYQYCEYLVDKEMEALNYEVSSTDRSYLKLRHLQWHRKVHGPIYEVLSFLRTHVSSRKNSFRNKMIKDR